VTNNQEIFKKSTVGRDFTVGRDINVRIQQTSPHTHRSIVSKPQNIPYRGSAHFVGRMQKLEDLHQQLQQTDGRAIIAGMGGVGKTELAIQYVKKYAKFYPGGVCWLEARTSSLVDQIFNFIYIHLGLPVPQEINNRPLNLNQQLNWCWQHWRPPGLVLLVLDDVIDMASCRELLPSDSRYQILITTRQRGLEASFSELPLDVLPIEASLELLTALIGKSRVERDRRTTEYLCEWLGHLPLALELVGRHLAQNPDLSIVEFSARLEAQRLKDSAIDLDSEQMQQHYMTAYRNVRAAFELSWQELEAPAFNVAQLLSLFALNVIPWELVKSTAQRLNWTTQTLDEAKKQLEKRFLIQQVGESCYKIHPLIREFLQIKLAESGMTNELRQTFAVSMAAAAEQIPSFLSLQQIQTTTSVIPHLEEVAKFMAECLRDEDLGQPFVGLARFYEAQGLYKLAEPWRKQCLSIVKTRLGSKHSKVAESLNALAMLYRCQGRYREAEPLFMQALDIRKCYLANEPLDVAESLHNLATLYRLLGRYSQAECFFKQALELRKFFLGEEHLAVAETLSELVWILLVKDKYNRLLIGFFGVPFYLKAESLLKPLEKQKNLLHGDHIIMVKILNALGLIYMTKRRYREAKSLFEKSLEMGKRLLGDTHPLTTPMLNNLALVYLKQRCYPKAELLQMQALEMQQNSEAKDYPEIAPSLNNLGIFYAGLGHYRKAESFLVRAKKHTELTLGANHPNTISYRRNLIFFSLFTIMEAVLAIGIILSSLGIIINIFNGKSDLSVIYLLFLHIIILIVKADIGFALLGIYHALSGDLLFQSLSYLFLAFRMRSAGKKGGILPAIRFVLTKTRLRL
jgi:tetratricopeptide (TPR) repeat protein